MKELAPNMPRLEAIEPLLVTPVGSEDVTVLPWVSFSSRGNAKLDKLAILLCHSLVLYFFKFQPNTDSEVTSYHY